MASACTSTWTWARRTSFRSFPTRMAARSMPLPRRAASRACRSTSRTPRVRVTRWKCSIHTPACCRGRTIGITRFRIPWDSCPASTPALPLDPRLAAAPVRPLNTWVRFDHAARKTQQFFVGADSGLQEPCFVPRSANAAEGDGYLIGTAHRPFEARSDLLILDAQRLAEGPLATVRLPFRSSTRYTAGGCRNPRGDRVNGDHRRRHRNFPHADHRLRARREEAERPGLGADLRGL